MNGWAWVLIILMMINTLWTMAVVGKRKQSLVWTPFDAIGMLLLTVLALLAVTQ